jgi:hypothetical protein
MKASTFCFSAILVCASLFTSKAFALTFPVRSDSGTQCYRLEAPASYTPDVKHLQDPNGFAYNNVSATPGEGIHIPISADAAVVAAVAWAGGHDEIDKSAGIGVSNYPNSLTNIGTKTPGGFYNAAYVHPIYTDSTNIQIGSASGYNAAYVHPFHVERVEGPTSYYIVEMTGVVAGERQKLYAYVLDDGMLVRPEVVPCVETYHRVMHHHGKWGGAKWGGEEKKKWGGAESKKKWGGEEKKKWGGAKPSPSPASTPHP